MSGEMHATHRSRLHCFQLPLPARLPVVDRPTPFPRRSYMPGRYAPHSALSTSLISPTEARARTASTISGRIPPFPSSRPPSVASPRRSQRRERTLHPLRVARRTHGGESRDLLPLERGVVGRRNHRRLRTVGELVHADDRRLARAPRAAGARRRCGRSPPGRIRRRSPAPRRPARPPSRAARAPRVSSSSVSCST